MDKEFELAMDYLSPAYGEVGVWFVRHLRPRAFAHGPPAWLRLLTPGGAHAVPLAACCLLGSWLHLSQPNMQAHPTCKRLARRRSNSAPANRRWWT